VNPVVYVASAAGGQECGRKEASDAGGMGGGRESFIARASVLPRGCAAPAPTAPARTRGA
jgi:hypothetical protein